MTSFAPGTNPDYVKAYNNWWFGQNGKGAAPQRSAFGPDAGQAQPAQPQSQGTPYGSPTKPPPAGMVYNKAPSGQAGNFSAYAPPQQQSNPFAQYNPQQAGNFVQQQMGLPSFQFTATDSFGNTYDNPAALTAQQGAMAQALNAQRAQQIQSGNLGPLNPMAAYQQAQNMVQGGWTNPFAPPMPNMGNLNNYGYGDTRPPLKSQAQPIPLPSPDAYDPGGVFFPPRPGQAQPIQPPSQGTQYGQPATDPFSRKLLISTAAKEPTPSPPQIQQGYATGSREHNEAAYKELLQQIRMSGGATASQDRRKRDLERRLGVDAGGQKPLPPGQAQPIQPPIPGTQYGQPATLMVGEYGQPPAQMPGKHAPPLTMAQIASETGQPPAQMPVRPEPQTLAVGEVSYGPGRPPSQPAPQQGPTLASFLDGLTVDDLMAKGGMMWSTLDHYLGGKLNAKQKTQLQQIQQNWRGKEKMKGGHFGAVGIWEMPPEAKYGPPEKRKKALAEWEQRKAWQSQRDSAELKQQLSALLNSVVGGGSPPAPSSSPGWTW